MSDIISARYTVTRVLLHAKRWRGAMDALDERAEIKITEDGIERNLSSGEWIQHASDGAIGEVVGECATRELAEEMARRLTRDNPNREHRVCLALGG